MRAFISGKIALYFALMTLGAGSFFFTVFLPRPEGFYAFAAIAALSGLGVATNIWYTKSHHGTLVCPTGSDCNAVITSRYSKFFGIPLEYLGMAYFGLIFISYISLIFLPFTFSPKAIIALTLLSTAAAFFSIYLLFVQAVLLKQWCIWCVLASMLSLVIFFISLRGLPLAIFFLAAAGWLFEALKSLGFVLGLGSSTVAGFLFLKFLHDFNIDERELSVLKIISELAWFGLALILIGQFSLYISHTDELSQSSKFIVQTTALFITGIAGAALLIIFAPLLAYVPFSDIADRRSPLVKLRRPTFVTGAAALSSWYFSFGVWFLPDKYGLGELILAYLLIVAAAVMAAIILESYLSHASHHARADHNAPKR